MLETCPKFICLGHGSSLIVSLPLYSSSLVHSHPLCYCLLLSSFPFLPQYICSSLFSLSLYLCLTFSLPIWNYFECLNNILIILNVCYLFQLLCWMFQLLSHILQTGWHKVIVCLVARIRRNMCLSDCHIPFLLLLHYSSLIFKPICVGIAAMTSMAHNKI